MPAAEPPRYKIPESVLVVIYTRALDVLLIRRSDALTWQSVTGSKDSAAESFADTAMREVMEETGIACTTDDADTPSPRSPSQSPSLNPPQSPLQNPQLSDWHLENIYDIYPRWLVRYAPGVTRNREHVFGLCVPSGTAVRLSDEHTAYQWLPYRAAADLCFSPSNAEAVLMIPRFIA